MNWIMGVDIGTTACKAIIVNAQGQILSQAHHDYPLFCPEPGAAEQNPDDIFAAVLFSVKAAMHASKLSPHELTGISFSSAMHSFIALDQNFVPLTQCITWADTRSQTCLDFLNKNTNIQQLYERTGTPIHPMSPLLKLIWLKQTQHQIWEKSTYFIGIKEYIFLKLFKKLWIDHSVASATGLFNIHTRTWDKEALDLCGISVKQLSQPVPCEFKITTGIDVNIANELGIDTHTPFIIGANDGALANTGLNTLNPGEVAISIGTSGAIRSTVMTPVLTSQQQTFCYILNNNHYIVGGPINNGGIVLRWLRESIAKHTCDTAEKVGLSAYEHLNTLAAQSPVGANGLIFHPYLSGDRAPFWNADLRASYFGLSLFHREPDFIRAAFEGILMSLKSVLPSLEKIIGPCKTLKVSGGVVQSSLWQQMLADIFNCEVLTYQHYESSCLGAAALGFLSLGHIQQLSDIESWLPDPIRHSPIQDQVNLYAQLFEIFLQLPSKLHTEYQQLAHIQSQLTINNHLSSNSSNATQDKK